MRRYLPFIMLAIFWLRAAMATTFSPLQGDVSGQLVLPGFGEVPPLDWHLQVNPHPNGDNLLHVNVTAPGLAIVVELSVPANSEVMNWRILDGEIDLTRWWRPISTRAGLAEFPSDLIVSGALHVTGDGTLLDKQISGQVEATIVGGSASSSAQKWSVADLDLETRLMISPENLLVQSLELRSGEASVVGIALRNILVAAEGDDRHRLKIISASVNMLGGRIALQPFTLDPGKLEIDTMAELEGVALSSIADFVPQTLHDASGQLKGRVAVRWNAKLGTRPGGGSLTLAATSPASLRLAATPGFLTQHTTERIQWLPDFMGPIARWLAVENPAYDTLRQIEMGDLPLQVEKLIVDLYPDGPNGTRSALVEVVARPVAGTAVGKVSFTLNVSGPLDEVLRLGSDERVNMNLNKKP